MEIRKTIQYTPADLQLGYSLHLKKMYPFRSKLLLLLGVIIILLGLLLIILQSIISRINWLSWGFIIYGIVILLFYMWKYRIMGKSAFKKLTNFHFPFEFTISEDKVITVGKSTTSESKWEHYEFSIVTEKIILLYPNKLTFVILPKQYFSDEEFTLLSTWVKEKVKFK
ncbi:MAG: YcxB family protein [Bacteroidota bacterium]